MLKAGMTLMLVVTLPVIAAADLVIDPVGDFLPTYSSGPQGSDLDVISSDVVYDTVGQTLEFTGTHAGPIGQTDGALYVWGLDRGQGAERFQNGDPAIGAGVFFDSVLILRPDRTGAFVDFINGTNTELPADSVWIIGGSIGSAALPLSLFPSTGLAPSDYTWNLWPRVGLGANNQITDFAPDASNAGVSIIPEPASVVLIAAASTALLRRRR